MSKIQSFLTYDMTLLSNYAQTIAGTLTISAVTVSGTQMICTYTVSTGSVPQQGCRVTITGMTHAGNNGVFVILAGGASTGSFTVTNTNAVATDSGTGYLSNSVLQVTNITNPTGTTFRYYYTLLEGSAPYTTDTAVLTACTNAANNGPFPVTAATATYFEVTNGSGVVETPPAAARASLSGAPVGPAWTSGTHQALMALGLTPTADTNQMNWSAVIALGFNQTNGTIPRAFGIPASWPTIAAWSSGSVSYTGATASAQGVYSLVTNSGLTWVCIANNTSSGSNGPNMSGGATNWTPYNFELWQTNGALRGQKIYFKFVYQGYSYASLIPFLYVKIGQTTNGTGDIITGLMYLASATQAEGCLGYYSGTGTASNQWECDFSSDGADTLNMLLWRNHSAPSTGPMFFGFDRSRNSSGAAIGSYFQAFGVSQSTSGTASIGNTGRTQCSFFPPLNATAAAALYLCAINFGGLAATSSAFNGLVPFSPVFPSIGYFGDPFLGFGIMRTVDVAEGMLINAVLYGLGHQYLATKTGVFTSIDTSGSAAFCIRWE